MPSRPDEIAAIFQLHREQGGGWIKREDIEARIELNRSRLPPLPRALPPLPLPPLPPLPPLLPPLPKVTS